MGVWGPVRGLPTGGAGAALPGGGVVSTAQSLACFGMRPPQSAHSPPHWTLGSSPHHSNLHLAFSGCLLQLQGSWGRVGVGLAPGEGLGLQALQVQRHREGC